MTTGCELFTWILKKSTTPPADAEVAAVVLLPGDELKARVVAPDAAASNAASNVLRQAIAGVAPPDQEEKKKEGEEEAAKEEKRQSKVPADDPDCPAVFDLPAAFGSKEGSAGSALTSKLVLEVSRLLFCRQWKLVATAPLPLSRHEALLFCRSVVLIQIRSFRGDKMKNVCLCDTGTAAFSPPWVKSHSPWWRSRSRIA